jgi:hypothetical protein
MSAPSGMQGSDMISKSRGGFEIPIDQDEVEAINLRAIGNASQREQERPKTFVMPKHLSLDLLFFRMIFKHMLDNEEGSAPVGSGISNKSTTNLVRKRSVDDHHETSRRSSRRSTVLMQDEEDSIPLKAFQRTLERLFYVLRDNDGFDAMEYDLDGNGAVGWGEFVDVCRKRKITIEFTFAERLFYTLERPDSSYLAQIVSVLILLVIATSSLAFILSTLPPWMPDFRDDDGGNAEPAPKPFFAVVETWSLWIFVIEYLLRLCACPFVRAEIVDKGKLLQLTTGYDEIELPSAARRLLLFVFSFTNLIDLAAILPGVISMAVPTLASGSGGGFVVLRLIRLTRIFRAPAIREPATVIAVTIHKSAKALFVLCVNLGLGIIIFGSLMYLAEKGEWNGDLRIYEREMGREWNGEARKYDKVVAESPFLSIPYTFWWAMVTATTVGYGDQYPTTPAGYLIAVATMMFSIVIAALPVGVVGGIFSQVWEGLEDEKNQKRNKELAEDLIVKTSLQRYAPFESMSRLLTVDVWNTRFPENENTAWDEPKEATTPKPTKGDFMGQARTYLELIGDEPRTDEITLPIYPDFDVVKRHCTGKVNLRLEWTPGKKDVEGDDTLTTLEITGTLLVTLVSAENLVNINNAKPNSLSNPYCIVICYPTAPEHTGEPVVPTLWRSPAAVGTLFPRWQCGHEFTYYWTRPKSCFDTQRWRRSKSETPELSDRSPVKRVSQSSADGVPQISNFQDLKAQSKEPVKTQSKEAAQEQVSAPGCLEAPQESHVSSNAVEGTTTPAAVGGSLE